MGEQENVELMRRGFEAFNSADVATLSELIAADAVQHMPGSNKFAGDHVGRDAILGMYGEMGQDTGGTFRAALQDLRADGPNQVVAQYQADGQRSGKTLATNHVITFEIRDDTITDITDTTADESSWDAFWA
jgi:ketosteroid isomerase-like protein